ncbi:MAG: hypothetical protein PHV34_06635 [Verrucomicrobiae bacterium]|nr:hypothetical protein [Verrucomicrobiae bacterium]
MITRSLVVICNVLPFLWKEADPATTFSPTGLADEEPVPNQKDRKNTKKPRAKEVALKWAIVWCISCDRAMERRNCEKAHAIYHVPFDLSRFGFR